MTPLGTTVPVSCAECASRVDHGVGQMSGPLVCVDLGTPAVLLKFASLSTGGFSGLFMISKALLNAFVMRVGFLEIGLQILDLIAEPVVLRNELVVLLVVHSHGGVIFGLIIRKLVPDGSTHDAVLQRIASGPSPWKCVDFT